jgi:hypothetical protein
MLETISLQHQQLLPSLHVSPYNNTEVLRPEHWTVYTSSVYSHV